MAGIESAFHFLGLEDAHELDLKADIVDRIGAIIKERKLTQATAGDLMGLGQAEVSKMLSGHLDRFTVDRLIKALASLGERVRVSFEPMELAVAPAVMAEAKPIARLSDRNERDKVPVAPRKKAGSTARHPFAVPGKGSEARPAKAGSLIQRAAAKQGAVGPKAVKGSQGTSKKSKHLGR